MEKELQLHENKAMLHETITGFVKVIKSRELQEQETIATL
jgi:hypothetical protein